MIVTNFEKAIKNYWNYYLELESELLQTKRYVEFDCENEKAFSIEFLKLFQAICSEIDVVGKYLASLINPNFKIGAYVTIRHWWFEIQDKARISTDIKNGVNAADAVFLCDAQVMNYVMGKTYKPWSSFMLKKYLNSASRYSIKLEEGKSTPRWWLDYTEVKHKRAFLDESGTINFTKANLKNVCESISALYLLELAVIELSAEENSQLERFLNQSVLFIKNENTSSDDIDSMFKGINGN